MSKHSTADFSKSTKLITVEDILLTKSKFELEHFYIPKGVEVSPQVYRRLHELLDAQKLTMQSFYGMKVIVDPDLKHGEWKFIA